MINYPFSDKQATYKMGDHKGRPMCIKLNYDKWRSSGKIVVDDPNLAGDLE
jgi:hypothetical protein